MRFFILLTALLGASALHGQTCGTVAAGATCDMTADLTGAVSWNASAGSRCTINAHNYRIDAGSNAVTIKACDVYDLGHTTLSSTSDYAVTIGTGTVLVDSVVFHRSNAINRAGNGILTVSNNDWLADSTYANGAVIAPGAPGGPGSVCVVCDNSAGANSITVTGNKLRAGGAIWVRNSSSTVDNNLIVGPRAGLYLQGSNGTAAGNYVNGILPVTCPNSGACITGPPAGAYPYWADEETFNLGTTGSAQDISNVMHDNVFVVGQWIGRHVNGEFYNNLVLNAEGHSWMNDLSGKVHGNIFAHKNGTANGYYLFRNLMNDWDAIPTEQGIEVGYANNSAGLFYNNTLDNSANAGNVFGVNNSVTGFSAFKNNVLSGIDKTISNSGRAAVGKYFDNSVGSLTYADYNLFHWVTSTNTNYDITAPGSGSCGAHDVGTCNVGVAPQYNGTDGSGTLPNFFPFDSSDVLAGTVTPAQIVQFYQYVYGPHSGSPLIGAGNASAPSDGTTIGAVQSVPSNPFSSPMAPVPDFSAAQITAYMPSVTNTVDVGVLLYLDGYAAYDGRSGSLTLDWSTTSGPGTVTFTDDPSIHATGTGYKYATAAFSASGVYVLRLTATAGSLSNYKEATITVGYNDHPRLWYTPSVITTMQAKAAANDPDWCATPGSCSSTTSIKGIADSYATQSVPTVIISSCTNANPMVCTSAGTLPFSATTTCYMDGWTAGWVSLNASQSQPPTGFTCTQTNSTHFSVPINSSSFGTFSGQAPVIQVMGNLDTGFLDYSSVGDTWSDLFQNSALAYLVTGTSSYCTTVKSLLDYINALSAGGLSANILLDSGFSTRTSALGLALGFDACYSTLTSGQKTATGVTLDLWYAAINAHGFQADPIRLDSNYSAGHLLGLGALAYALVGDDSNAQTQIDHWMAEWTAGIAAGTTVPSDGTSYEPAGTVASGNASEGFNYGGHTHVRWLEYLLAVKTATNSDIFGTFPQLAIDGWIYKMRPDRVGAIPWGDAAGNETVVNVDVPILVSYVDTGNPGAWAQWEWQNKGTPPGGTINQDAAPWSLRFPFYNPARTATDPASAHNVSSYRAGGLNIEAWRSGWGTSDLASWGTFSTTFAGPHQSKNGGSIAIWRGADAMLPGGGTWKGTTGWTGSPSQYNQGASPSFWWNTLFFYDGDSGPYCQGTTGPQAITSSYYGCQMPFDNPIYNPTRHIESANYQYLLMDQSHAYDTPYFARSARTLRYYLMDYAVLGDGVWAVMHRGLTTNSTYPISDNWWFSPEGTPSNSSGTITNTVGSSQIWLKPVLPASPSLTLTQVAADGTGDPFMWQLSTANGSASTNFTSLTGIVVGASGGGAPTQISLTTIDAHFAGIQIQSAVPKVFVAAQDVTYNSGPDSYTSNMHAGVTFTTTHSGTANYLVAGLTAGTYSATGPATVACNGTGTVGADGTCYFSGPSGAWTLGSGSSAVGGAFSPARITSGGGVRR